MSFVEGEITVEFGGTVGPAGPAGSVGDGNKGDVTVSSSGTVWAVNDGLVYVFPSLLDVVGVESGDLVIIEGDKAYRATGPASFVPIVADPTSHTHTFTKSQLNTSVTDGDVLFVGDAIEFTEQAAPSAPATNGARLFAQDNGSGKTQLCVRFATGAIQVIATEP